MGAPDKTIDIAKSSPRFKPKEGVSRHKESGKNVIPFCPLHHAMFDSPQFDALPLVSKVLTLELGARYNGRNNGRIGYGIREGKESLNISGQKVIYGLRCLEEAHFTFRGAAARFSPEGYRLSAEYGLAFVVPRLKGKKVGQCSGLWSQKTIFLTEVSSFIRFPIHLLKSKQFRRLSLNAKAALMYVCRKHNPDNNGEIQCGTAELAKWMKVKRMTAWRALQELEKARFIVNTLSTSFHQKGKCRKWRITFHPPKPGKAIPDDWKKLL